MVVNTLNPLVSILKGLVVLLVALLLLEVLWFGLGDQLQVAEDQHSSLDYQVEPADITPSPAIETFSSTVSRSLFNWNRKPKETVQQTVSEEGLATRWQLSGVVNTGNATYALFSEADGSRRLRLEQGMYLEKWRLESITPEKVVLNSDDNQEVFYLKETTPPIKAPKNRVQQRVGNIKKPPVNVNKQEAD